MAMRSMARRVLSRFSPAALTMAALALIVVVATAVTSVVAPGRGESPSAPPTATSSSNRPDNNPRPLTRSPQVGGVIFATHQGVWRYDGATGAVVRIGLRGRPTVDKRQYIVSSDHATLSNEVPESICIIGAGAVGVEFATFYNQLGVNVTLLEALDRLVPLEDEDVSKEMLSTFKKAGIDCRVGVKVNGAKKARDGVSVDTEQGEVWARQLLVAVGRAPRSKEIGLEQAGVTTHPNGFIKVDEWMRTSADGIHAIGDVTGGYLLAHAAAHEGMTAAEDIAGQRVAPMEQELVTRCTYSHPQVASVGLTEKQAREKGHEVKVGKFPFTALGRAIIHGETAGFVKVVADGKTGQVLGTHIVGANATELIAEPALTQLFQGDAWEIGRNIHPHPTLSEAVMEASLAVDGHAIHI